MKLALASLHVICLKDASLGVGGGFAGRVPGVTPLSSPLLSAVWMAAPLTPFAGVLRLPFTTSSLKDYKMLNLDFLKSRWEGARE